MTIHNEKKHYKVHKESSVCFEPGERGRHGHGASQGTALSIRNARLRLYVFRERLFSPTVQSSVLHFVACAPIRNEVAANTLVLQGAVSHRLPPRGVEYLVL